MVLRNMAVRSEPSIHSVKLLAALEEPCLTAAWLGGAVVFSFVWLSRSPWLFEQFHAATYFAVPLTGVLVGFLLGRRSRRPWRDASWAGLLALAAAGLHQTKLLVDPSAFQLSDFQVPVWVLLGAWAARGSRDTSNPE